MDILIKGMKMPTKENVVILITPSGDVWMIGDMPNEDTHLVKAKAIPVPPHERLIEGSKVLDIVSTWCPDDDGSVGKVGDLREMLDEIEALPTIIEAQGE